MTIISSPTVGVVWRNHEGKVWAELGPIAYGLGGLWWTPSRSYFLSPYAPNQCGLILCGFRSLDNLKGYN
jgi:hypothetical protein